MGFDLAIPETSGIPDGSLVSIEVGNVRRQAFVGPNYERKPFNFPEINGKYEPMKVDVFYPIAQARLLLDADIERLSVPLFTDSGELAKSLPKLSGDEAGGIPQMSIDLKIAKDLLRAHKDEDVEDKNEQMQLLQEVDRDTPCSPLSSARRHKTTLESQQYLEDHWLLETFQALMRAVIMDRPSDPRAYMIQYLRQPMDQHLQMQQSAPEVSKPVEVHHRESPLLCASGYPISPGDRAQQWCSGAYPEDWMPEKQKLNAMVETSVSGQLTLLLSKSFGEQKAENQQHHGHIQVSSCCPEEEEECVVGTSCSDEVVVEQIRHPLRPDETFPPGKFFYCSADDWSELVGVSSAALWNGRQYDISQKRGAKVIWSGAVVLNYSSHLGCYGYRVSVPTGGQFEIGDMLSIDRSSRVRLLKPRSPPARETPILEDDTDVSTEGDKSSPARRRRPQSSMKAL